MHEQYNLWIGWDKFVKICHASFRKKKLSYIWYIVSQLHLFQTPPAKFEVFLCSEIVSPSIFCTYSKSVKRSTRSFLFNTHSNYNIATVQWGGILRFSFADSLSVGKAANHSSGHAGVERSNELLMGNGHSSKLKSTTSQSGNYGSWADVSGGWEK